RAAPMASGRAIFCCPRTVAVTALGSWWFARVAGLPIGRLGIRGRESNEPRTRFDAPAHRVGLAARVTALAGERHQKSRGPDLAHGSGFVWWRLRRLSLARDGHRSPARVDANGRRRRPEEEVVHLHSESPP